MTTITKKDIGRLPPVDTSGQIKEAAKALDKCREWIKDLPWEWQYWVAESLVAGLPLPPEQEGAVG